MSAIADFAKRVEEKVSGATREPHWERDEADRYMTAVAARRQRFERLASRLIETIVQPRLETVAGHFSNANFSEDEPAGRCSCWFGYCERFPASTRVGFAIEHDLRIDKVAVCYEASMMPVFIKLNERDKMTVPLDEVEDDAVAIWVEQRLFDFLDAYLRIDRGGDDFGEEAATDPVCGMRIKRSAAVASESFRGHPYYFCSQECQERFVREPTAYVEVKAM